MQAFAHVLDLDPHANRHYLLIYSLHTVQTLDLSTTVLFRTFNLCSLPPYSFVTQGYAGSYSYESIHFQ